MEFPTGTPSADRDEHTARPQANGFNPRDLDPVECQCTCEPAGQTDLIVAGIIFLVAGFVLLIAGMILAPIFPAITAVVIYTCSTVLSLISVGLFIGASCANEY